MKLREMNRGTTFWFFGRAGAGKTHNADLFYWGHNANHTVRLDGDLVRKGLTKDCGYDEEGVTENIRRIVAMCKILNDQGIDVVASFITPLEFLRQYIVEILPECVLNWVDTPFEICYERRSALYATGKVIDFQEPQFYHIKIRGTVDRKDI